MSAFTWPLGPIVSRESPSRTLPSTFPSIKRSAFPVNSPRMRIPCVRIAASGDGTGAGDMAAAGFDGDGDAPVDFSAGGAYGGGENADGAAGVADGDGFPSGCFRHMETSSAVRYQESLRTGYRPSLRFRHYSTELCLCKPTWRNKSVHLTILGRMEENSNAPGGFDFWWCTSHADTTIPTVS